MAPGSVRAQERLISTYYDTQTLELRRRGLSLRVREQAGRFIQTVKAEDTRAAGLLARGEWEDVLAENRPDPAAAQSGPHLPQGSGADLRPLFTTDIRRTVIEIEPRFGTRIEAAVDQGEVRLTGGDAAEPISEIELELKSGEPAAVYDLALQLLKLARIRIEMCSKSERGYRLASGSGTANPVYAKPLTLDRDKPVEAALQEIGSNCLAQLVGNEGAVLAGLPDGVHQMRVAARRIRSAVSSLKKMVPIEDRRWIAEELGWLAGVLGRARNLDVFAGELLPAARAGLPDKPGWEDLAATLARLRQEAHDNVKEAVLAERYTAAMLKLLHWFEARGWREKQAPQEAEIGTSAIGEVVGQVLDRRWRKIRRRSGRFAKRTPPERHKLRIAVKKLRYTTELFSSLLAKGELQSFIGRLKQLQDDLGHANDVHVAHGLIVDQSTQTALAGAPAQAWLAILEWHDFRLAARERKLCKRVRRLRDTAPFWRN